MSTTIVVCGFGPGISTAVAEKFGREGFSVALVARRKEKLDEGVKALEAKGIKPVRPYRKRDPAMNNIATATIVDPWGVSIELTEGLDRIQ